jgi:hypothetical protein
MPLPFTKEQFFDLFAAYNEALWPAAVALWIASAVIVALRLSARRPHDPWISALLVGHWAWSALAEWAPFAWGLIGYSLAYPAINAIDHLSLLRIPTFGLPCPTTIFTAGVLMLATPRSWRLSTVPVIWSAIGGSATFLLGVHADVALPIAGMALAIFSLRRTTPEQLSAARVVRTL